MEEEFLPDMNEIIRKATALVEALPYIQDFRGNTVVVKFGGSAMDDPECTRNVIRDIVFMECAGMKPVIVHGGGKAISAELARRGIKTRFVNGLRYTDDQTIKVVDHVLHDQVNAHLVATMAEFNGKPYAMSGKNVLRAQRIVTTDAVTGEEKDLGHVGEVMNVDTEQVRWVLKRGEVPVITPLARDMDQTIYNVNADMAACRIAAALKARKLVFLSDVPGILREAADESSLISTIHQPDVNALIRDEVITGGMVPKVRSAVEALIVGTEKVHMIDGRIPHSLLLECFTDRGVGTQIIH